MILITGGAGYIGSHFVAAYLANGGSASDLMIVDNFLTGQREQLSFCPSLNIIQADCRELKTLESVFKEHEIETVIHFAGSCYVAESQDNPVLYFQNNVAASLNLLTCIQQFQVPNLIFSSSCATYGIPPTEQAITEDTPQVPINIYGLSKLMVEQAILKATQKTGLKVICLRYFNAAGANLTIPIGECHNPEPHVIPNLIHAAIYQSPFTLYGTNYDTPDGTCIRDYVHVMDIVQGHLKALQALAIMPSQFDVFNLGSGQGVSIKTLIKEVEKITQKNIPLIQSNKRPGDPPALFASFQKAKKGLNWSPQFTLNQMLEDAYHWRLRNP